MPGEEERGVRRRGETRQFVPGSPRVGVSIISGADDQGEWDRLIVFQRDDPVDSLTLFKREWDKELEAINLDSARSLENCQDQRLARAIKEGLSVLAKRPCGSHSGAVVKIAVENPSVT